MELLSSRLPGEGEMDPDKALAAAYRFLESRGFRHVGVWPFEAAKKMIDRIAVNGWRTPPGVNPETYIPEPPEARKEPDIPNLNWPFA